MIKITITPNLDADMWGLEDPDVLAMTDDELVELFQEDISEILEGATWKIERE